MKNLISAEPKTLPSTMRYVAHGEGGGPQVLQLAEGSVPAPGPREVLIEVAFAGVNGPDVQQRSGHYPPPPRPFLDWRSLAASRRAAAKSRNGTSATRSAR